MKNPLISIIVPIFNMEKYLDKCIQSLVNQTYKNIEIILIDDGSSDRSGEMSNEWTKRDERIKVVHKDNAGLGLARNTGLENATGDYILFLDADDFLDTLTVQTLVERHNNSNVDSIFFGWKRYYNSGKIEEHWQKYRDESFEGNEIISKVLLEMVAATPDEPEDRYVFMSACHCTYSMELIKRYNVRFVSERELISEDLVFNIDYLRYASKVEFIPYCFYFYRDNTQSLTSVYKKERFEKEAFFYQEINRRLGDFLPYDEYSIRTKRMFLGRVRSCIMRSVVEKKKNALKDIREIQSCPVVRDAIEDYPYQQNPIQQRLFNCALKFQITPALFVMAKSVARKNLRK